MIKVYLNRKVSETQITIGNQYESGVNAIAFDLSELKEKWPNGNIYLLVSRKAHTWPYSIDDGEFKIEYVLTWKRGFYQMNVVVTDEKITDQLESSNTIFVSDTINAYVNENQINAKALNEQELPRELQIVYDDLITLKKNIEKDLADGKYIGPQGPKGEKGEPGPKGDPGDVTEEYRNLANQIAQNASDAQVSATNAQTSATNAQKALDDTKEFANQTKKELNQIKADTNTLKEEANASAVNAKASETKAKEYADNLQASTDDISKLKEDLVANSKEDAKTKRSLSALWDLNKGISYRFETDSEKAYQKKVPSGAKLGSVNKVGGKTIVMNQLIDPSKRDTASIEFDELTKHFKYSDWNDMGVKYICKNINLINGHKYYIYATDKVRYTILYLYGDSVKVSFAGSNVAEADVKKILTATGSGINNLYFNRYQALPENVSYFDGCINLIDLTKMFGSGNEPSTPEEFEAMLPNDYYPYNEGELMSMSVNDVIEKGRNLCDCYGFSAKIVLSANGNRALSNDYGTSISTIEPVNTVIVTQSRAPDSYATASSNGFFYIGIKGMTPTKSYTLSFDFTPTNFILENSMLLVLTNGRFPSSPVSINQLNTKRRIEFPFEYKAVDDRQIIEIRLSGMSGVFENFQLDEGNLKTAYTPYYAPISHPIPQVIQSLEGYGWSAGTAHNYVDYENKKYYKCVDRINLDNYTWLAFQRDSSPFYYCEKLINELNSTFNVLGLTNVQNIEQTQNNSRLVHKNGTILDETNKPRGYLYYELAEPIITDISDIIGDTFQEPFEVESGGSLTFKNTNGDGYQVAVPSDIQYTVALSEVNA